MSIRYMINKSLPVKRVDTSSSIIFMIIISADFHLVLFFSLYTRNLWINNYCTMAKENKIKKVIEVKNRKKFGFKWVE